MKISKSKILISINIFIILILSISLVILGILYLNEVKLNQNLKVDNTQIVIIKTTTQATEIPSISTLIPYTTTSSIPISTTIIPPTIPNDALLNVIEYSQKYPLSCEAAATSVALKYIGLNISEDDVLTALQYDLTPRKVDVNGKIIWGDPYKGYIGNYNGIFHQTGYGVYAPPIANASIALGAKVDTRANMTIDDLYKAVSLNRPAIVWVPTRFEVQTVNYWYTPTGTKIPWIQHEHTMVFRGYNKQKDEIYLMDVYTGKYQTRSSEDFIRGWSYLGNQAVIFYK